MSSEQRPQPTINADSAAFWEGLKQGRLVGRRCNWCGAIHAYPVAGCHQCGGMDLRQTELATTGTIVSFTVIHRPPLPVFADQVPYNLGHVDLDGGGRLLVLLEGNGDQISIGCRVQLLTREADGEATLPTFSLIETISD